MMYTQSPVHVGAGSTIGAIDLPIEREVHTGFPVFPGSGLKGSLRAKARTVCLDKELQTRLFGTDVGDNPTAPGRVSVGDAQVLAFPVRSLQRPFLWVTCSLSLGRFTRDLRLAALECPLDVPADPGKGNALVSTRAELPKRIMLEDVELQTAASAKVDAVADFIAQALPEEVGEHIRSTLRTALIVVSDGDYSYFVRHCTQVSARIQLTRFKTTGKVEFVENDKKKMQEGNLWYEETLPTETILYSLLLASDDATDAGPEASQLIDDVVGSRVLGDGLLQVGGNETVGQGWCWVGLWGGE